MDQTTFNRFRQIVYEHSGISLSDGKVALVTARIGKRMRSLGLDSSQDYLRYLKQDESGQELINLLDVISTNVTHFYREAVHFDFVSEVMKEWLAAGQKRFRFWSAACSTGEEPYTLAITLKEVFGGQPTDAKILATDISTRVLALCQAGLYSAERVKPVPPELRTRYFDRVQDPSGPCYQVKEALRQMVVGRRLNLSAPPFPMRGPLDIIFCRNVMIYFDDVVRRRLLAEMHRLLKPGGYLLVGHAESLTGMVSDFKVIKPSIYIKA